MPLDLPAARAEVTLTFLASPSSSLLAGATSAAEPTAAASAGRGGGGGGGGIGVGIGGIGGGSGIVGGGSSTASLPGRGAVGRSVRLRARDLGANADEDGVANMRAGGRTNYFVFPGDSGQDPTWLVGEAWRGVVALSFADEGGREVASEPFVLLPHSAL